MDRLPRAVTLLTARVEGLKIPARDTAAATQPTVRLDNGAFVGTVNGSVKRFLGIPFALPPTGNRRFRRPAANRPYSGTHNASAFGPSCPQQASPAVIPDPVIAQVFNSLSSSSVNNTQAEDCLSLNIWAPANATRGEKLPVLVWIYAGGFENGQTAGFDGGVVVQRALNLGLPMIYVSMNYRLSLFGFLGGKEVKQAGVGNLGLHDQRQALRWIQRYISAFGGDTNKVTIWGESAGAISVASHMVAYGGNTQGLFHGAVMQSGSPIPTGDITTNQPHYDAVVNETGCAGAADTLQCLRGVSFASLQAAANKSPGLFTPQSLNLEWLPLVDGDIFTEDPQVLVQKGSVANIPFITGDCDDEGTLFTLALTNLTTNNQTRNYLRSNYLPSASDAQVDQVLKLYPEDPIVGSPFDTGIANAVTPQYKRLAAFQGDLVFQAPRRFLLEQRSGKQNAWSFLFKRGKLTPVLGTYHSSDLSGIYDSVDGNELKEYIIRFAVNFDPNGGKNLKWPKYTPDSPQLMTLLDGLIPLTLTNDTFRKEPMDFVTQLSLEFPLR
ncbi:Esterase/lipase/thioesterase [Heterobasidion irregulare TC 32-1]|uniref:Carboxylic ester hydrolase n=1 Tax=Heterobasidion irregulare (strain TC 32-1) TaxID=747525 RepID=W4K8T3_HETIT|nr:Esterase/lipase/thioesterase [Heterobasidion irregulare TC 32-1]ETW82193.1 Esterase/lipase/thioesterase [Heterobasidion irregulare TC 32-1]